MANELEDYYDELRWKAREEEHDEEEERELDRMLGGNCRRCGNIGCPDCSPDGTLYY